MSFDVLYVDDDRSNLTVFQAAFGRDFKVQLAESGEQALELMAQNEVAVLLSDQRMPGLTGVELLTMARQRYPDTERYLVTAYSNLDEAIQAVNLGHIRRYLRKPWAAHDIRQAIREGIETWTLRKRVRLLERQAWQSERIYALGVVAAGVAHELRNPLGSLLLQTEMAEVEAQEAGCGASILARMASIRGSVLRVRDILDGMSIAHRSSPSGDQVDLNEVVRLTLTSLKGSIRSRANLNIELTPVPPVRGSSTTLGQVVLNLLVNALQALPEGEPPGNHEITVRLSPQEGFAVLEIEDTGRGIPPEVLPRLFEPFFTTKESGGTGLGLAISRRIVEDQGGSIEVAPGAERGSLFRVRLPLA